MARSARRAMQIDELIQVLRGSVGQGRRMQKLHVALTAALLACASGSLPDTRNPSMSIEANKQVVRKLYDECINPGRLDLLAEVVSDDFVGPQGEHGPTGFAAGITGLRAGFPDLKVTVEDIIAEGDRVTVRSSWQATHTGVFR